VHRGIVSRQPEPSGVSTATPGFEDTITGESILLRLIRPMPAILITTHDTEHQREVPLDAPNERSGLIARDLSLVGQREPGVRNEENKDRGNLAERPPQAPAENTSQVDHPGENAQEIVQSGGSKGERRVSRRLLIRTKVCQSQEETGRTRPSGSLGLQPTLPWALPKLLAPSKPP
jgi:hypothetical protein